MRAAVVVRRPYPTILSTKLEHDDAAWLIRLDPPQPNASEGCFHAKNHHGNSNPGVEALRRASSIYSRILPGLA